MQCMTLAELGGHHISFDISYNQLMLGRYILNNLAHIYFPKMENDQIAFIQGDGEGLLPFKKESAKVAYGIGVLNHIPPERWFSHILELSRITCTGGKVFQVIPNLECEVIQTDYVQRQFSDPSSKQYWLQFIDVKKIVDIFEKANLHDIRAEKLWLFDHDIFTKYFWRIEHILYKMLRIVGLDSKRYAIRVQRIFAEAAERKAIWARKWTYKEPRHIIIYGTKKS